MILMKYWEKSLEMEIFFFDKACALIVEKLMLENKSNASETETICYFEGFSFTLQSNNLPMDSKNFSASCTIFFF